MITLLSISLEAVRRNFVQLQKELDDIPPNILCDVFYCMVKKRDAEELKHVKCELIKLDTFMKLLGAFQKRNELLSIFQTLNNYDLSSKKSEMDSNQPQDNTSELLPSILASAYVNQCNNSGSGNETTTDLQKQQKIHFRNGMLLGEFLSAAGWFCESAKVLSYCLVLSLAENDVDSLIRTLDCLQKLLTAQSQYCMVKDTTKTYTTATVIVEKLKSAKPDLNLATIYCAFSNFHFNENRYSEALSWGLKSLKELDRNCGIDKRIIIDVLRQASKCCAVRREIEKAKLLITEAVYLARENFGTKSIKYAEALLDLGYFLINSDSVRRAVTVYSEVVDIRKEAFGVNNYLTACALEELAYSLYVHEYSSGHFQIARQYSEQSISVFKTIVPTDHVQFASAKRVLALILEEIAIDNAGTPSETELLKEAESLHIACLQLSTSVFGEMNVTTAKHYGNLGRLYQTMKRWEDSELMHVKAISIKEKLLGKFDYEVALSIGHLASLYNYDLHYYEKAEKLHLQSIEIGKKLFGDSYSGLEYDYRGLLQVYSMEGEAAKFEEYSRKLSDWRRLQELKAMDLQSDQSVGNGPFSKPVSVIIQAFFNLE